MSEGGTSELQSFRRSFVLLLALVVVPSAGLSGFGVLAIINERAAVEKRLEETWHSRLVEAQALVLQSLHTAAFEELSDGEGLRDGKGEALSDLPFRIHDGVVDCADASLRLALATLSSEFSNLPERLVFFSLASPAGNASMVAVWRRGAEVVGARVAPEALAARVRGAERALLRPEESANLGLRPVKRDFTESGLTGLLSNVNDVRDAALGKAPFELASVAFASPLQDFRLVALAEGEDPVSRASFRNRTVYVVLLALLYLALAFGVVITGRTLYREARLSRLKTDFVSLVSHELRTPLTAIRLFIDTLAMGRVQDAAQHQEVLDLLSKETARLSALIERVLDWARIESGKKHYSKAQWTAGDVVQAALEAFTTQRLGSPVPIAVDIAPNCPVLFVDKDAMAGALLNLVQNAFKYTGDDKRIAVRARPDHAGGVRISVEDNGVGIAANERKRIFDRFYRVDDLLTRTTEGSGLGLSIASRIAAAHGGRITVDSTLGRGSTFTLHLPKAP